MKKKSLKLRLSRETLQVLDPQRLRTAQGAGTIASFFSFCDSCGCPPAPIGSQDCPTFTCVTCTCPPGTEM